MKQEKEKKKAGLKIASKEQSDRLKKKADWIVKRLRDREKLSPSEACNVLVAALSYIVAKNSQDFDEAMDVTIRGIQLQATIWRRHFERVRKEGDH